MPRLRWPDSTNPVSEEPGTVHLHSICAGTHHHPSPRSACGRGSRLPDRRQGGASASHVCRGTVCRGRPLTCPDDGQTRAVKHEMDALAGRDRSQTACQMLTAPGERRIVGSGEVEAHHPEQGVQEPFSLAQREMVEEPQGQGGLDGEIRVAPLSAPPAAPAGRPGSDRFRGHNHTVTSPRRTRAWL